MTWTRPDPLGAGMAAAGSFLTAQQQAKKDAAEAARQAELDRQAAIMAGVHNAYETAQTGKALVETTAASNTDTRNTADEKRKARLAGDDVTPLTMATPQPGKHFSAREQATQYRAQGNLYLQKGANDAAKPYFEQADKLEAQADKEDAAALAVKKQLDVEIHQAAEAHHWTAQETQARIDASDRLLAASRHDATTLAAAAMHVRGSLQVAGINRAGAMDRTLVTQHGDDKRHQNTEDNLNRRFNVGERHKAAVAATTAAAKGAGTAYTRGVEAYNAIAKGETYDALSARAKASVRSAMVDHGMSVQDAIAAVSSSNNPDKAAILQALGGK